MGGGQVFVRIKCRKPQKFPHFSQNTTHWYSPVNDMCAYRSGIPSSHEDPSFLKRDRGRWTYYYSSRSKLTDAFLSFIIFSAIVAISEKWMREIRIGFLYLYCTSVSTPFTESPCIDTVSRIQNRACIM